MSLCRKCQVNESSVNDNTGLCLSCLRSSVNATTDTEYGDRIIAAIIKSGFLEIENAPIVDGDEIIEHAHVICWAANAPEQLHTLVQNIITGGQNSRCISLSDLPRWKPNINLNSGPDRSNDHDA